VTPSLGARAPALTASTIPPLSVWPCAPPPWRVSKHRGAQTAIGPSQWPSRSLETARPVGRAVALDLCPGAKREIESEQEREGANEREREFIRNATWATTLGPTRRRENLVGWLSSSPMPRSQLVCSFLLLLLSRKIGGSGSDGASRMPLSGKRTAALQRCPKALHQEREIECSICISLSICNF
jgi:hypothetical protein